MPEFKFVVQLKDPDGVYDSTTEAVEAALKARGITGNDAERLEDSERELLNEKLRHFVEFGEVVRIEFTLDSHGAIVARVMHRSEWDS